MTEFLQQLLEREREAIVERDEVGARKMRLMKRGLNAVSRAARRSAFECAGGAFLRGTAVGNLHDDVSLEDAPYFRTVWPVAHAIVVPIYRK